MARMDWNKKNLALLKSYMKDKKLAEVAVILKCTENAAKLKYNRLFPKNKKSKADVDFVKDDDFKSKVDNTISVNPFVIEQVPFTGVRATSDIVLMLVKQMLNINANKLDSIYVSNAVAHSKKAAGNLFLQAKNYIAKTNKAELVYTIKSTFSCDSKKQYLSARIWRLQ